MPIIQTTFTEETRRQFMNSDKTYFGSKQKVNKDEGTYVILQDLSKKEIFGIAKLGVFSETGNICRRHHPLDTDIYTDPKYNMYDVCILKLKEVTITYDDLAFLIGVKNPTYNNITRNNHMTFKNVTCKQDDEADVLRRLNLWVTTVFNSA